ncbi:hypothetical protein CHS0354_023869 [Potamilus streckersoni]|uniref:Fibronectin type-III domain-containing protein n=1 Tax=Potamilus streckersoni TaxID=2493646 RepID=A0AAE0VL57_9BIVA|nr:hypothetical protein CHS0354_023869 [Potamilus streckersoni]
METVTWNWVARRAIFAVVAPFIVFLCFFSAGCPEPEIPTYIVTVDPNSGTLGKKSKFEVKSGQVLPIQLRADLPTKQKHIINSWNTKSNGSGTEFIIGTTIVSENITIYPQWVLGYNVKFESNGGSFVDSLGIAEGKKATKPADPTRTGYTFVDWYRESILSTPFNFNEEEIIADITLYAKWKINIYTITLNANGGTAGTATSVQAEYNKPATLTPAATPSRAGYALADWNTKSDGTGDKFIFGETPVVSDITIYAQWSQKVPEAPTRLSVEHISSTEIKLTWAHTISAASYKLYDGSTLIAEEIKTESYTINRLAKLSDHSYTVEAKNAIGTSPKSESLNVTTKLFVTTFISLPNNPAPSGITVGKNDTLYLAERDGRVIKKIDKGGEISTIAGTTGASGDIGDGNTATSATFSAPYDVAIDKSGNIYVADINAHVIRKINATDKRIDLLAGTYNNSGNVDATKSQASFSSPRSVAVDKDGNVYVADQGNHRIRKITPGGVVSTLAGDGTTQIFNNPAGVAVDTINNVVYVADQGNHRIRKITSAGDVSTFAGTGTSGSADGDALSATFNGPTELALDKDGNIYVVDQGNKKIRRIRKTDGKVTTIAGNGQNEATTEGEATKASFVLPFDIVVTTDQVKGLIIYVTDQNQNKILKLE